MRYKRKAPSFWTRLAIFAATLVVVCLVLLMILSPGQTNPAEANVDINEAYTISEFDLQYRALIPAVDTAEVCKIMSLEEYAAFCESHQFSQRFDAQGSYAVYSHVEQEYSVLSAFLQKALYDPLTKTLTIHFVENYVTNTKTSSALLCVVPVPSKAEYVKVVPLYQQAFEDDGTIN